jgi:recombination protein RecT
MKSNGQDAGAVTMQAPKETLKQFLVRNKASFEAALPKGTINVERFIAAAAMEISNNPTLMACDRGSIVMALGQAARYGLEVGSLLGQAWLIPYNETRLINGQPTKVMTCHFQLGYKGLIVLARRSQTIKTICAEIVYSNDYVEVELGMNRHITHKVDIRKDRGEPIAYYCIVELQNGGVQFEVMTKAEAEKHRDRYSKAHQKTKPGEESIWDKNFDEMALKTVVIKTLKLCPISIEALEAVSRAEREEIDVGNEEYTLGISEDAHHSEEVAIDYGKVSQPQQITQPTTIKAPSQPIPQATVKVEAARIEPEPTASDVPEDLDIF